jgi:hypothetical protein
LFSRGTINDDDAFPLDAPDSLSLSLSVFFLVAVPLLVQFPRYHGIASASVDRRLVFTESYYRISRPAAADRALSREKERDLDSIERQNYKSRRIFAGGI